MRSVRRNSERFTRELGREVYGTNGVVSNGAMLHLGPAGRIGITEFRDPASGERRLGGVISADLYSLLEQHMGTPAGEMARSSGWSVLQAIGADCGGGIAI